MTRALKLKLALIGASILIALIFVAPSLMWDYQNNRSKMPSWWKKAKVLPTRAVVLGLDLQGGMHLVIGVRTEEAVKNEMIQIKDYLRRRFRQEKVKYEEMKILDTDKLQIRFIDKDNVDRGTRLVQREYGRILKRTERGSPLAPIFVLDSSYAEQLKTNAVQQVMETISSRVDEFGVTEPSIQRQGKDRIVIQLPGIKEEDRQRVLNIIKRTAKLEFMLVDDFATTKEALLDRLGGVVPPGKRLLPEVDRNGNITGWYLLREEPKITGDYLVDARVGFQQTALGGAVVHFKFNLEGARRFARITGEHIGERLAIVLENKVRSAPVIRSRIYDRGVIEGDFTVDEARDLAIVLRAGALPVSIEIEEERTVGPSLGKDLINRGKWAILLGGVVVLAFMVIYYMGAGLIADLAILLNLLFIMAMLAGLRATLTLPGIAGIALTVGMAVDANIIIFERIREEWRTGKTPRSAIEAGYQRSLWTVLDANITTLIAAAILFQVGTGPIRGFAVTLTLGIISSLYTALFVTRTIYDLLYSLKKRKDTLSIGIKLAVKE